MSPPLVIAFALAGDAERDLSQEPVQTTADGRAVHLRDLWPDEAEIDAALAQGPAITGYPALSGGPCLHRAAASAVRLDAGGRPIGPLRRASAAGARRRRDDRPPVARQRHSAGQPDCGLPRGARRRPQ
ncbi:hypothetical protein G6F35_015404 [Rhizopus arrhizus]|nr:hypothetical protein G6F35_015404 [Rhizopus arrhizus]